MSGFLRPLIALPIAIAFILAVGQCTDLIASAWGSECFPVTITRIVDGDTVDTEDERIRLAGIDTPETWRPSCAAERMRGQLATQRLAQLIYSADVVEYCPSGVGKYGRTIAVIRVDGVDVGEILIAEGLARAYDGGRREGWCE